MTTAKNEQRTTPSEDRTATVASADDVISLLRDLVAIDSVNPTLSPGGAGEAQIAQYVAQYLVQLGLEVRLQEPASGRLSAIGVLPGAEEGKSLILNAHLDTVGLGDMDDPLSLRVEGDRAYGRGAYDMKGSLAAILLAVKSLAAGDRLAGDVVVMAVADEEYASLGTQAALKMVRGDAAVMAEPTGMDVCVAHKGFAWIEVETEGRAAHGSRPEAGVDAIGAMGDVLAEFNRLGRRLKEAGGHPLLGPGSLHASLIQGGQELSTYPARCIAQLERRTLPGETAADVAAEVASVLQVVETATPEFKAGAKIFFWRDAFAIDPAEPLVTALVESATAVIGRKPAIVGQSPWMDAAFLSAAGIPTVVFGPGGEGAHGDIEWVSISDIAVCAGVFVELARRVCS